MKPIETLEAELWLAQRAHRRNPSDENQAAVEAIEAEIATLNSEEITSANGGVIETIVLPTKDLKTAPVQTEVAKPIKVKTPAKKKEEQLK